MGDKVDLGTEGFLGSIGVADHERSRAALCTAVCISAEAPLKLRDGFGGIREYLMKMPQKDSKAETEGHCQGSLRGGSWQF